MPKIQLSEIAELNANSISTKSIPALVEYLDTGNITKNIISKIQAIDTLKDKLPNRAQRRVKDKTIIYSTVRPNLEHYGFMDRPSSNLVVSTGFTTIDIVDDNYNPKYIYYLLTMPQRTDYLHTLAQSGVSAYPSINPSDLGDMVFDVPDRPTQDKVVFVLEALDAKISINSKVNSGLEALARDLYSYWFVQFEFPDDNQRPYKTAGGAMVYNAELKREIPESWTVSELGKTLKTVLGGTPSTKNVDYWHLGDIPWVSSGEVSELPVTKTLANITEAGLKNSAAYLLPRHTVLISIVRHIRVSFLTTEATTNQSVVGIIESDKIKLPFIYLSALSDVPRLLSRRTGAQQPHINKDEVDSSPIVVPDDETLRAFNEITIPMFEQIEILARQKLYLEELRDQLLPLLMTGQVSAN
jgi:type I restriction enzyme S subunit